MLEYTRDAISARTAHPALMSLFIVALGLAITGVLYQNFTETEIGGAFFIIFAGFFAFLGAIGYVTLFIGKRVMGYLERKGTL